MTRPVPAWWEVRMNPRDPVEHEVLEIHEALHRRWEVRRRFEGDLL